jgi:DNA topoisomerase I
MRAFRISDLLWFIASEEQMKPRHTLSSTQVEPIKAAKAVGLRYVSDAQPGLRRLKAGTGFVYRDAKGAPVRDEAVLKRIRSLVIPPAWTDVWICPYKDGHLQATGRDAKGRKQHRYHPLWREVRDATKYDRMIEFGEALPRIRRAVARDLAQPKLRKEKVLATIVQLMDLTFMRVGNDEYAKQNGSYGLTTLKDQHAKVRGEGIQFSFRGKSGKHHSIEIEDRRLAKMVKRCQDIPGQDLFQWIDSDGKRHDVTSGDVNDYLRQISDSDFTAKDFRTWAGTVLTAQALKGTSGFKTQKQAKANIRQAIAIVAEKLGNTVAVCRKCYIHPFLLDGYLQKEFPCNGAVTAFENGAIKTSKRPMTSLGCDEKSVLDFLCCCRREEQRAASVSLAKPRKDASKMLAARSTAAAIPRAWRPRVYRGMRVGHR